MEATEPSAELRQPPTEGGLGRRLVAAREALGLTLADVAQELRLPAATLQALESGRFDDLPEPIFVRGYLRAYARLLEMDEVALVAEYDRLVDTTEPVLTTTTKVRRQATARDPFIRGATVLIVLAMAILLGFWWYNRLEQDGGPPTQTASSEVEGAWTAPAPPPPQIVPLEQAPEPVTASTPESPPSAPAEESGAAAAAEPPSDEVVVEAETPVPAVAEPAASADVDTSGQGQGLKPTVGAGVANLPIAPLAAEHGPIVRASRAPTGEDVLLIKANDESWAEVVDANGYQLLYYPLRAGMVRRVQGQAPFRVKLGYAPGIDLSLNQERFDHTPFHRRNGTARFSVDDAS